MKGERLNIWFSLSYASWLTLPRILMQEMPEEWQNKMVDLLEEYELEYPNQPDIGTRVMCTDNRGKLIKTPRQLINYRHPDLSYIQRFRE